MTIINSVIKEIFDGISPICDARPSDAAYTAVKARLKDTLAQVDRHFNSDDLDLVYACLEQVSETGDMEKEHIFRKGFTMAFRIALEVLCNSMFNEVK